MMFEEDEKALEAIMGVWADQLPVQDKAKKPDSVGKS